MKFAIGFTFAALLAAAALFGEMVYSEAISGYLIHIAFVAFPCVAFALGAINRTA